MPRVGNKRFPYTREGREAAEAYAAQVGLPVESDQDRSSPHPMGTRPPIPAPRNVYQATTQSVQDRRRRRERPADPQDRYGRFGYADETRREHEDRLWDRDWDEDVRGRRWNPTSRRAGER